jgi:uncharacterized protein (DUF885 family)
MSPTSAPGGPRRVAVLCSLLVLGAGLPGDEPRAAAPAAATLERAAAVEVRHVADDFFRAYLDAFPDRAHVAGVAPRRHDGLSAVTPAALSAWRRREDAWLAALERIDHRRLPYGPEWAAWGALHEQLAASVGLRACRLEWWDSVNHMESWHLAFARVAELQPVDTPAERTQALVRWHRVPGYIRADLANVRAGLAHGYTVPRSVAARMLTQLDGLASTALESHPYASPARRSPDPAFATEFRAVIAREVLPAVDEYRRFLEREYLPRARASLAVSELPNGPACYAALLRASTTLPRPAEEVYALGQRTVAGYRADVIAIGRRAFGLDDYAAIIARTRSADDNRFAGPAELLAASRELVTKAQARMPDAFGAVPEEPVAVEPVPDYEDGAGASSHYDPPTSDGHAGVFRISLAEKGATRGGAEITAFHETWPGHHLQISYARRVRGLPPVMGLIFNSGYVEGWARYAESLAEELRLYETDYARIQRRAWPARGMVLDPGLHAFHWSREQAIAFAVESGRFSPAAAEDLVDRIAALPGQLTAYDSGGLEIAALRRTAEQRLGDRFDLRAFHDVVLETGSVPLPMLSERVGAWIEEQARIPRGTPP